MTQSFTKIIDKVIRVLIVTCVLLLKQLLNQLNYKIMKAIEKNIEAKKMKQFNPEKIQKRFLIVLAGWVGTFVAIHLIETYANVNILMHVGITV